jgi:hypothetical protein
MFVVRQRALWQRSSFPRDKDTDKDKIQTLTQTQTKAKRRQRQRQYKDMTRLGIKIDSFGNGVQKYLQQIPAHILPDISSVKHPFVDTKMQITETKRENGECEMQGPTLTRTTSKHTIQ